MNCMLSSERKLDFATEFRRRLEQRIDLPPLPEVACELLWLRDGRKGDVAHLTWVIEQDPGIAAQLLAYARLSVFGYGDRIKSVDRAVQLVLGYEKALHMAIGLSAGKSLRMQAEGPVGRRAFWTHSLQVAMLTQALASALPPEQRPQPGVSYLAGLLHDIGYLLFGHLYPEEFAMLNRLISNYSERNTRELELIGFGITHDMIGLWLMQAWNMPEEIIVAVGEHHFSDYDGKHAIYPKLVALACQLMKAQPSNGEPVRIVVPSLDEERMTGALGRVQEVASQLEAMARDLAA